MKAKNLNVFFYCGFIACAGILIDSINKIGTILPEVMIDWRLPAGVIVFMIGPFIFGILAGKGLFGQCAHDAGEFVAVEPGKPFTAGTAEREVPYSGRGYFTDRTVYRQMVSTPGLALKKCALVFNKVCFLLHSRKLVSKFYVQFFNLGIFFLQVYYALIEESGTFFDKADTLPQNGVDGQSGNKVREFFEHKNPPFDN